MKTLIIAALLLIPGTVGAMTSDRSLPSCDLPGQHALEGRVGGRVKDSRQAHISARADVLQADVGTARRSRRLTQAEADGLFKRVDTVRRATDGFVGRQGFLSAAERASYDRALDAVAARICRP